MRERAPKQIVQKFVQRAAPADGRRRHGDAVLQKQAGATPIATTSPIVV